jgi:hypothetical protein
MAGAAPEPVAQEKPQFKEARMAVGAGHMEEVLPLNRFPEQTVSREQLSELDIPTFIRRQMD